MEHQYLFIFLITVYINYQHKIIISMMLYLMHLYYFYLSLYSFYHNYLNYFKEKTNNYFVLIETKMTYCYDELYYFCS